MNLALARLANNLSYQGAKKAKSGCELLLLNRRFGSNGDDEAPVVGEDGDGSSVSRRMNKQSTKSLIWNIINRDPDFVPALYEYFPSGLGDAIIQATNNFNELFETKPVLKSVGPVKELENCYKMRCVGIGKENVKIFVKDGLLRVKEDGKEEDEYRKGFDDEKWSWSFGCYEKTLVLPTDAKADEIKAEVKDGVLNVVVPRIGIPKNDVKELPSS